MTLTPVTLTFHPVWSLPGPSLMHIPSLDEIGLGVFEISKIFNMTLTFDPVRYFLRLSLLYIPSLDETGPGVFEISRFFI